MENETSTHISAAADEVFGDVRRNWGWLLALGILFVILGAIGMSMSAVLTQVIMVYFGILLLIGGGAQIIGAFKATGWKSVTWHLVIALLYVGAGILVVTHPARISIMLTGLLGAALLAVGIVRIIEGIQMRHTHGGPWLIFGGLITMLLGGGILGQWPVSGLRFIGLFVAVELMVNGFSCIVLALVARPIHGLGRPPERQKPMLQEPTAAHR